MQRSMTALPEVLQEGRGPMLKGAQARLLRHGLIRRARCAWARLAPALSGVPQSSGDVQDARPRLRFPKPALAGQHAGQGLQVALRAGLGCPLRPGCPVLAPHLLRSRGQAPPGLVPPTSYGESPTVRRPPLVPPPYRPPESIRRGGAWWLFRSHNAKTTVSLPLHAVVGSQTAAALSTSLKDSRAPELNHWSSSQLV